MCRANKEQTVYDIQWNGWTKFYGDWDRFVRDWFESGSKPTDSLTQALESIGAFQRADVGTRLDRMELPEPYYGKGETAKCDRTNFRKGNTKMTCE